MGHHPCGNCNICPLTKASHQITIKPGDTWHQRIHTNCNTKNCVYLMTCPCDLRHVGLTTRSVKLRINEHWSTIRCKRSATKLTNHFHTMKHGPDDLRWTIIEAFGGITPKSLLIKEHRWIHRLSTGQTGLNDEILWSSMH